MRDGADGDSPRYDQLKRADASLRRDDLLPVALRETTSSELLEVALDDAYPFPLEGTVLRIRAWIERLLSE